jgi:predicted outer membrane protein
MRNQSILRLFTLLSLALAPAAAWAQNVRTEQDPASRQQQQREQQQDLQQRDLQQRQFQSTRETTGRQATAGQADEQLVHFFAAKLALMNQAEAELAQLATTQASDAEVKQLAQRLIQSHQQLNQEMLQAFPQLASLQGLNNQRIASQTTRQGQTQTDRPGAGQERRPDAIDRTAATEAGRTQAGQRSAATTVRGQSNDDVTGILLDICRRATENHVQMAKQSLQSKQGKDFDACWVGSQICAHQMLVAELKALENIGTPEFQQIIQKAEQESQQHLRQAEQLAQRLTSSSSAPNR